MIKIKPIMEGQGETKAIPPLLHRIAHEYFHIHKGEFGSTVQILIPGRYCSNRLVQYKDKRWEFGKDFDKAIGHAQREEADAVLILLDIDKRCAKQAAKTLTPILHDKINKQFTYCTLVFAVCEYESWFLASATELGNINEDYKDPEKVHGAAGKLEEYLGINYSKTIDQAAFTHKINLQKVHDRCRSFRKIVKEYKNLLTAYGLTVR